MPINVNTKPFDLNKFWDKTPTPLKYILLIAIIVAASYFLFSRKVDVNQIKELNKIEQGIETTYELVEKFETFTTFQTRYNDQLINDIKSIYILVTELNDNVNKKFDYIISNSGKYNTDLLDKMQLLNESFDKLTRAYQPKDVIPEPQISVKKIEK